MSSKTVDQPSGCFKLKLGLHSLINFHLTQPLLGKEREDTEMLNFIQKTFLTFFLLGLLFSYSKAAEDLLPEVMVGNPRVWYGAPATNIYGGFSGSEVVYNHTNDNSTNPNPVFALGQMMGARLSPSLSFNGQRNSNNSTFVCLNGSCCAAGPSGDLCRQTSLSYNTGFGTPTVEHASRVDCGQAANLSGEGAFSVSLWFKRNRDTDPPMDPNQYTVDDTDPAARVHNVREMLIAQTSGGMFGDYWLYFNKYNQLTLRTYGDIASGEGGYEGLDMSSSTPIPANDKNWHHVVAVRNGDGNGTTVPQTGSLWLDGVDVTQTITVGTKKIDLGHSDPNQITSIGQFYRKDYYSSSNGVYGQNPANPFKGNIDEVRTYDKALTEQEIARLHQGITTTADNTAGSSGLKAYYKFDEGAGNNLVNSVGANTCTASNTTWDDNSATLAGADASLYDNFGYDLFGFNLTSLTNCINGIILGPGGDKCFVANSTMTNVAVMNSRTYVNDQPVTEVAALMYPPKPLIVGDAYLGALDPNNFAYWGKNLVENDPSHNASTNSYWGVGSYTNALASDLASYQKNIDSAKSEAVTISASLPTTPWYLQGSGSSLIDSTSSDASKYPNGKVWKVSGNVSIPANAAMSYSGKGTIIIDGNLWISDKANILPANADSRLGIIVLEPHTIMVESHNKIQATILGFSDFNIGSNCTLTGSFVAKNFPTLGPTVQTANTRFIYDTGLNKSWPPIFGELKMPHASE